MDRRQFIMNSGMTLGSCLFPTRLFAQVFQQLNQQEEFFVQITIPSGWDILLATEPWLPTNRPDASDLFLGYQANEVQSVGGIPYGPAMAPLKNYLPRMAVINGIFVSRTSTDHLALRSYMMTGTGSGRQPAVAMEYLMRQSRVKPWGLLLDQPVGTGTSSIATSPIYDLMNLTSGSPPIFTGDQDDSTPLQTALKNYFSGLPIEAEFITTLKELQKNNPQQAPSSLALPQVTAAAFKVGLANSVSLQLRAKDGLADLDTHVNHDPAHRNSLTDIFEQIANLMKIFDSIEVAPGVSMLSRTNMYITSEFSRLPALNNSQGKDHNAYTNSALVMGPRIKGGQVIGGSKLIPKTQSPDGASQHVAQYVNPTTGQVITKASDLGQGILLKPETVVANLLGSLGIKISELEPDLSQETLLKVLVK